MVGLASDDMNGQEGKSTGKMAMPTWSVHFRGDQLRMGKEARAKGSREVAQGLLLMGTWGQ